MKQILTALFILLSSNAFADTSCELVTKRSGATTFTKNDRQITYRLVVDSEVWSAHGYGWHGTAAIVCDTCDMPEVSWGLVNIYTIPEHRWAPSIPRTNDCLIAPNPTKSAVSKCEASERAYEQATKPRPRITTAKERIERGREMVSYPLWGLTGEELTPLYSTDDLRIDEMKGYGVVYKIKDAKSHGLPEKSYGILVFNLNDGCALFSGSILVPIDNPKAQLLDLISAINFEKSYDNLPEE